MRLPVLKVLWGMFAFPVMYPGSFLAAAGTPLLIIIAIILVMASDNVAGRSQIALWCVFLGYYALFSWLAVRCHRMVLGSLDLPDHSGSDLVGRVSSYLAAIAAGSIAKSVTALLITMLVVAVVGSRYVAAKDGLIPPPQTPAAPDPAVQRMIDYLVYAAQVPALYLLARLSPMLPAVALGHGWSPGTAWRISRGNGWRLVLVVFLLPWAFESAIDHASTGGSVVFACLAVVAALLAALGIIALSLAYRELTASPAPPPTAPPA